jgi:hypothetical protein
MVDTPPRADRQECPALTVNEDEVGVNFIFAAGRIDDDFGHRQSSERR